MSIDVSYKSFSPSRADQRWKDNGTAVVQALVHSYTKVSLTWDEEKIIKNEAELAFEDRFKTLLGFLKSKFKGTSMDYEWNDLTETYEFLSEAEKNEYDSLFNDKKNLVSEKIKYAIAQKSSKASPVNLKAEDLLEDLMEQDIEFGSVGNDVFAGAILTEETWIEDLCIRIVCEVFVLPVIDDVPTKDGWILMYNLLDTEKLTMCIQKLSQNAEIDHVTAKELFLSYLKEVKPVVRDLTLTPDAIFYRDWGGDTGDPVFAERLLKGRAKKLLEKYRDSLPNFIS